ncbi:WRAP73 [Symbiodinium sp. CCMP2592]|nr:WRAP73 [Symbiodinium sp. CCMP2592]
MARRAPQLLTIGLLAALFVWNTAFLQVEAPTPKQAVPVAAAAALSAAPLPALAGEPPSVGIHWYWDLGIGTIHGETASIIIWVFLVCTIFALAGAGGSSRKSDSASFLEEKPVPEVLDAEGIPKQGITLAAWSPDEHFLATKHVFTETLWFTEKWVCVLLSLCALVAGAVFHEALVARLASIGIAAAHIQFESVDVGTIRNSQTLSPRILASVSNPSPVNADVRMSRLVLKVPIFPSGTLARVGTVTMPSLRVQAFQDMRINISAHVHIEDLDVFGLAGKHAVREPNSSWVVEGKLQVRCELPFFAAHLSDIPFEREVALKGMASFSQDANPVTMEAITSAYGYPDHLDTTVAISIYNPSYLSAHLDTPTHFNITQRGHPFGTAVVQEVILKPGHNTVEVRFLLQDDSSNREAVREFIVGYIRADMQMVTMHGTKRSCSDPLLAVVLDGLDLRFHFKPPAARFIHHITANLGLIGLQVTAEVANPLPQRIEIGGTDLSVRENTVEGEQIFRLKGDEDSGLGGQVLQPSAISKLKLSLSTLDADLKDPLLIARLIEDAVDGAVVVGVSGPLSLTIAPNFTLTLNYIANNVTASLTCLLVCGSSHSLLNPVNWFPSEG